MRPYALRAVLALLGGFCVLALPLSGARAALQGGNGKIAYVSGATIMLADADGTGSAVATAGDNPSWNGEGTKIAYDVGGTVQVYAGVRAGGRRCTDNDRHRTNPAFSPDGTKVAYVSPGGEILVMNADGSGSATNLTQSGADDTIPPGRPTGADRLRAGHGLHACDLHDERLGRLGPDADHVERRRRHRPNYCRDRDHDRLRVRSRRRGSAPDLTVCPRAAATRHG